MVFIPRSAEIQPIVRGFYLHEFFIQLKNSSLVGWRGCVFGGGLGVWGFEEKNEMNWVYT